MGALIGALDWGTRVGDRKYHQRLLRPGEDVYVHGTATPVGAETFGANDFEIVAAADDGHPDAGLFLVAGGLPVLLGVALLVATAAPGGRRRQRPQSAPFLNEGAESTGNRVTVAPGGVGRPAAAGGRTADRAIPVARAAGLPGRSDRRPTGDAVGVTSVVDGRVPGRSPAVASARRPLGRKPWK